MPAVMIGCTYLGIALCYAASASAGHDGAWIGERPKASRLVGLVLLGLGGARAVTTFPVGEGLLVWGATAMAACSILVIIAPLLDRFVALTGTLAGSLIVLGLFL